MEQLLNNLPQHNLRHISWRAVALIVVVLVAVTAFLIYAGGFEVLSRIFGSKAGTENTFVLAGLSNLEGNSNAADWLVRSGSELASGKTKSWPAAVFDGTGAFSSFTGEPDFFVAEALEAGFVMPIVSSLTPGQDTFANHSYISPAINLGATGVLMNSVKIYAYLPETATATFGYRTSDVLDESAGSELHELSELSFASLPEDEDAKLATITLDRTIKQYLRMEVNFNEFEVSDRPAVYGWIIEYGQTPTDSSEPIVSAGETSALKLIFSGGPQIPAGATIRLLCTNLALNPIYNQSGIDLAATGGEYIIPLKLRAGSYTIVITSPTTGELIVPFEATGEDAQTIRLGAFEAGQSGTFGNSADLNNDGKINSMDFDLLLRQYGEGDLTES